MKKLKLQVQMSVDGFIAGPKGEMDWMTWNWDDKLKEHVNKLTDPVDTILLGRKMTDGFVRHWTNILSNSGDPSYAIARKMVDTPKVVFTKTLDKSEWENTTLAKGNLADEVNKLKKESGGDIIVYGGAGFVSSLIRANLIDEYHLFVNPAAIGDGLAIFRGLEQRLDMKSAKATPFDCGIVELLYQPA